MATKERKYEKTSKLYLIFPQKYDYGLTKEEQHEREIEALKLLDQSEALRKLKISMVTHTHETYRRYRLMYGDDESITINEEQLKGLVARGFHYDGTENYIKEVLRESVHYLHSYLSCVISDNDLIDLRSDEDIDGYSLDRFYPPERSTTGAQYEKRYSLHLTYTREYTENPQTAKNKDQYQKRIKEIQKALEELFPDVIVYITHVECEYREITQAHKCVEVENNNA